jgi:hypothetical protein
VEASANNMCGLFNQSSAKFIDIDFGRLPLFQPKTTNQLDSDDGR